MDESFNETNEKLLLLPQAKLENSIKHQDLYMGVSKNSGTPKWMVKIMEFQTLLKMDGLGGTKPLFFGNTRIFTQNRCRVLEPRSIRKFGGFASANLDSTGSGG